MAAKTPVAVKAASVAGKAVGKKVVKPAKNAKSPARREGRPSSYKPEYAELAHKFCLLGATDERLAELFGVCIATLHNWRSAHPQFLEAVKRGKDIADAEVAAALFHRAKGYTHPEDDIRTISLPAGGGSEIVITATTKHYPPDTAAAMNWLKNRQPETWREKVELEHSGKGGGPIKSENTVILSADESYRRMLSGGAE